MADGQGPLVKLERRRAERVQDAVGLKIIRLQDQPAAGDAEQGGGAEPEGQAVPTHKISLSSVGLAFAHDVLMQPGELITVEITLFPSVHIVRADARIVAANDAPEIADGDKPTYRIAFETIDSSDRDFIEEHIKKLSRHRLSIET